MAAEERRGLGGFLMGLDDRIVAQAESRAENARTRAIRDIMLDMKRNPEDEAFQEYYKKTGAHPSTLKSMATEKGAAKDDYMMAYADAAQYMRDDQGVGSLSLEGINNAMAENPYVRYGVAGTAAAGGGVAMTAGAQQLMQLMGLLQESQETEVARQMPLES